MIRVFAKWAAKKYYVFNQEFQASTADLHAGLSLRLAGEKRALIEKLNKEADDIEANIKAGRLDHDPHGIRIASDRYYAAHLLGDLKDARAVPILWVEITRNFQVGTQRISEANTFNLGLANRLRPTLEYEFL